MFSSRGSVPQVDMASPLVATLLDNVASLVLADLPASTVSRVHFGQDLRQGCD